MRMTKKQIKANDLKNYISNSVILNLQAHNLIKTQKQEVHNL